MSIRAGAPLAGMRAGAHLSVEQGPRATGMRPRRGAEACGLAPVRLGSLPGRTYRTSRQALLRRTRAIAASHRSAELRRQSGEFYQVEHEVLAPRVQVYGDVAIATYTLLMRYTSGQSVRHTEHNETRVFHRRQTGWQLVHCHKSPMWPAPHQPFGCATRD